MTPISRRDLLKALLGGTLSVAGTVVLARAAAAAAKPGTETPPSQDVQARADRLKGASIDGQEPVAFLNGAFRNGGGFRNGGFANGGGFRNSAFKNGGFANGAFRNGGFANGGFRNGSFRNW